MKIALLTPPNFKNPSSIRRILELRGWSIVKKNPDYVLTIGGDGSTLYAESKFPGKPIISIKHGKMGFLSCGELNSIEKTLELVEKGKISIEERKKLEYSFGKRKGTALNDIVVTESRPGRSLRLTIKIGNTHFETFVCDGVVFTTPTGSTGYNLSCGGPVIEPGQEVFAMTLINPHTSKFKSIVLPLSCRVEVGFERAVPAPAVVVDGNNPINIKHTEKVRITGSEKKAKLVKCENNYFSKLRTFFT